MRINYIDRLKGLAIILVVMGHVLGFALGQHSETSVILRWIGSFHMPLFMFLSGAVLVTPPKNVFKKILKLIGPFLFFGIIFSLYLKPDLSWQSIKGAVIAFFMHDAKMGYWYLLVLAEFYILLQLFNFKSGYLKEWVNDVLLSSFIHVLLLLLWTHCGVITDIMCFLNCACYWPFFIGGYLFRKYGLLLWLEKSNWIFTFSIIFYLLFFNTNFKFHALQSLSWRLILPMMAILSISYLFVSREKYASFIEKQLEFVGKHTLDIYILHYFIVSQLNCYALGAWFNLTHNLFLEMLFVTCLSLIITYLSVLMGRLVHKSDFMDKYVFFS